MYRYKLFLRDGNIKILSAKSKTPKGLVYDLDGLIDWDVYESLNDKKMTTKEVLKLAFKGYKFYYNNYYRMEIINDETNAVIDFIEEKDDMNIYQFRFCYRDGSTKYSHFYVDNPNDLFEDLDGLIDWDIYDSLFENQPSLHYILELAFDGYRIYYKDYYRIDIFNIVTHEIIDYIEEKEAKI